MTMTRRDTVETMLERAFQLAHFILEDREAARRAAIGAVAKLEVAAAAQARRCRERARGGGAGGGPGPAARRGRHDRPLREAPGAHHVAPELVLRRARLRPPAARLYDARGHGALRRHRAGPGARARR